MQNWVYAATKLAYTSAMVCSLQAVDQRCVSGSRVLRRIHSRQLSWWLDLEVVQPLLFSPRKKKRRTIGSAFLWQSVHEVGRSCRKVHIACLPICHLIATRARHEPSPVISHALARDRPLTTFAHHVSYAVGVRSWCRRLHGLCHPQAEKMLCFDQWP